MDDLTKKVILLVIGIFIVIIATFVGIIAGQKYDIKEAIKEENKLELELHELAIYPGAEEVAHRTFHKEGLASVSSTYVTQDRCDNIRSYYIDEAPKKGWRFLKEEPLKNSNGVTLMAFTKNNYKLVISYEEDKLNNNSSFDVSIRWQP